MAQAAVQSGMGLYTFIWAKIGSHLEAIQSGTVRILAKSAGSSSSSDLSAKVRRPTHLGRNESVPPPQKCPWWVSVVWSLLHYNVCNSTNNVSPILLTNNAALASCFNTVLTPNLVFQQLLC